MITPPYRKEVPISQGEIGKQYKGYKYDKGSCICRFTYLGDGKGYSYNNTNDIKENVIALYDTFTSDDREKWYKDKLDLNDSKTLIDIIGLYHDMYDVGDARHEMWNAWVEVDFYEQIVQINDEDFNIIGVAPAPWKCGSIENPVAIVAEYEDGERFWCHAAASWIEHMREQGKEIYQQAQEKVKEFRKYDI